MHQEKIKRAFAILMCFCCLSSKAQDIHFSQFYETSVLRNPALTGFFTDDYKVSALYRSQWNSISKPFQTGLVTGELRIPVSKETNDFMSFGLLGYYNRAGSINMQTVGIYPAINYSKSLEENHNTFLSVGFTGGYLQRSVDLSKMTFDKQYQQNSYDPANPTGENLVNPQVNNWDLGAGINFSSSTGRDYNTNYFIGVSGYHFTKPKLSFLNNDLVRLEMKLNATAGVSVKLSETNSFQFHGNYMNQGSYNEVIAGGFYTWSREGINEDVRFAISGGLFYRLNDALIPTARIKFSGYTLGMSYDCNVSSLRAASKLRGGFEIALSKAGWLKDPTYGKSKTICPVSFY